MEHAGLGTRVFCKHVGVFRVAFRELVLNFLNVFFQGSGTSGDLQSERQCPKCDSSGRLKGSR